METKFWPKSSTVHRTTYFPDQLILEIEVRTGKVYRYKGFPPEIWERAKQAESIGKFMHANIINQYEY